MTSSNPAKIRADLARGHILLGELEAAYACLSRVVTEAPELPGLDELLEGLVSGARETASPMLGEAESLWSEWRARFEPSEPVDFGASIEPVEPIESLEPIDRHESIGAAEPVPEPSPSSIAEIAIARERRADLQLDRRLAQIARLEAWLTGVRKHYAREGRA